MKVGAFFKGQKPKEREQLEQEYQTLLAQGTEAELKAIVASLQQSDRPLTPFHWEIEFPEVFDRENPGFDAIVGNPPFIGGRKMKAALGEAYQEWISEAYLEASKNADIVAYFFRRAFSIIRESGCLGLIATNTIAQGDTRSTGLRFICQNGGTIYSAQKRVKWPGLAAVVISVVNIYKGEYKRVKVINERKVGLISAFLFHSGGNDDPKKLAANQGKSFQGSIILGMGFTFDDSSSNATSINEMKRLIEKDRRNAERIFPYIGGEEVNSTPNHAFHRYAINFFDLSEEKAREWPDLMKIIEEKVGSALIYGSEKKQPKTAIYCRKVSRVA